MWMTLPLQLSIPYARSEHLPQAADAFGDYWSMYSFKNICAIYRRANSAKSFFEYGQFIGNNATLTNATRRDSNIME
jgi:hypothetical protein